MGFSKSKPFRSKEFMSFLHSRRDLVGDLCPVCNRNPWVQLHHFGNDGGTGMKPSDLYLVRVCKTCADKYEIKMRALLMGQKLELLTTFLEDAMHNVEEWLKYRREHGRLPESKVESSAPECF